MTKKNEPKKPQKKWDNIIESAMMRLVHREPFYANLLMNMTKNYTTEIPTLGVNVTETVNLHVNPYFWANMSIEEQIDVLKHECLRADNLIDTDIGRLTIKEIVENQLKVKVKSINLQGKVEYKEIYEYSKLPLKDFPNKKWVSVKYSDSCRLYATVKCTNDHRIAYVENPLFPQIKFDKAENCKNRYGVRNIDINRKKNKETPAFNNDQLSFIIGGLLGDSSISIDGCLHHTGSLKYENYTDFKKSILGGKITKGKSGYTGEMPILNLNNGVTAQSKHLREMVYINGKKTIAALATLIDTKSLAAWYMDDGTWDKYNSTFLRCEGLPLSDKELLVQVLENFDITSTIYNKSKGYQIIKISGDNTLKFHKLVAPYCDISMQHKFKKETLGLLNTYEYDNKPLNFSLHKITKVKFLKDSANYQYLYDIAVADNHNFFANNTLVHNCHHVVNNHFVRFKDLDPHLFTKMEKKLIEKGDTAEDIGKKLVDKLNAQSEFSSLNQAADYAINEYLPNLPKKMNFFDADGNMMMEPDEIDDGKGGKKKNKNAGKPIVGEPCLVKLLKKQYSDVEEKKHMEYYHEFLKQKQQEGGKGQQGSDGARVVVIDDHGIWSEGDQDEEYVTEKVRNMVNKAVEQTEADSRSAGSVPNELLEAIEQLNHVPRNWKQDLRRFVARTSDTIVESTRKRRNRRYGIQQPGYRVYPRLHLALLVDSSGSVATEELAQFASEMGAICRFDIVCTLIEFDTQVNGIRPFNKKSKFEVHGRGGTHFRPAFEEAMKLEVDGIICFTDGGDNDNDCPKPRVPVLWALTGESAERYLPYDFGYRTKIEIKKKR